MHILKMIIFALAMIATPILAYSHSGGTDAQGCHTNSTTGDSHCHSDQARTTPWEFGDYITAIMVILVILTILYFIYSYIAGKSEKDQKRK